MEVDPLIVGVCSKQILSYLSYTTLSQIFNIVVTLLTTKSVVVF